MSWIQHEVIIVTSEWWDILEQVMEYASSLFGEHKITNMVTSDANGFYSFMVGSNGSFTGREEDRTHTNNIDDLIIFMNQFAYSNDVNSSPLQYVLLTYGDRGSKVRLSNQIDKY